MAAIERQTAILQQIVSGSNLSLITAYDAFKENIVNKLTTLIEIYIDENPVNVEFAKELLDINTDDFGRKASLFE